MDENQAAKIQELEERLGSEKPGRIHAKLAEAYRQAGDLEKSLHIANDGVAANPSSLVCHEELGRTLHALGWFKEAVTEFQFVYTRVPENLKVARLLALCHAEVGNKDDAEKILKDLLAKNPLDDETKKLLSALEKPASHAEEPVEAIKPAPPPPVEAAPVASETAPPPPIPPAPEPVAPEPIQPVAPQPPIEKPVEKPVKKPIEKPIEKPIVEQAAKPIPPAPTDTPKPQEPPKKYAPPKVASENIAEVYVPNEVLTGPQTSIEDITDGEPDQGIYIPDVLVRGPKVESALSDSDATSQRQTKGASLIEPFAGQAGVREEADTVLDQFFRQLESKPAKSKEPAVPAKAPAPQKASKPLGDFPQRKEIQDLEDAFIRSVKGKPARETVRLRISNLIRDFLKDKESSN